MNCAEKYSELTRAFEAYEVDAATFDHGKHMLVAYELLHKYGFIDASTKYATGIEIIAAKAGVPQKFNATITYAYLSLIGERMANCEGTNYDNFISQNDDLLSKDLLNHWYSPERLQSPTARNVFLLPDRQPTP